MSECKASQCDNEANDEGPHRSTFCSVRCEVRYDHIRMDAKDAMLDDTRPEGYTDRRWGRL